MFSAAELGSALGFCIASLMGCSSCIVSDCHFVVGDKGILPLGKVTDFSGDARNFTSALSYFCEDSAV